MGVPVPAHHGVAPFAGERGPAQVSGAEGQGPAARPGQDDQVDVLTGDEEASHRVGVGPGPGAHIPGPGPPLLPGPADQVLGEAGLGFDPRRVTEVPPRRRQGEDDGRSAQDPGPTDHA